MCESDWAIVTSRYLRLLTTFCRRNVGTDSNPSATETWRVIWVSKYPRWGRSWISDWRTDWKTDYISLEGKRRETFFSFLTKHHAITKYGGCIHMALGPCSLNHGNKNWKHWFTTWPLYSGERASNIDWTDGWVRPQTLCTIYRNGKSRPPPGLDIQLLSRPACSQSLYRLRYRGSLLDGTVTKCPDEHSGVRI
jgi:hypothetical protein